MSVRAFPPALLVAVAVADGRGASELAFYLLLVAIPAAASAGLARFGDLVDAKMAASDEAGRTLQALGGALALTLVVVSAGTRSPFLAAGTVPAVARTAVLAALAVTCLQAVAELVTRMSRRERVLAAAQPTD